MIKIENLNEGEQILKYGETNWRYAETYFNHKSSRSHTIFSLNIWLSKVSDKGESYIKESQINFVDLAGNERLLFEYKIRSKGLNVRRNKSLIAKTKNMDTGEDFYNSKNLK